MSERQSYKGWALGSDGFHHYFNTGSSKAVCDEEFVVEDGVNHSRSVPFGQTPCPNCLGTLGLEELEVMYVYKPHAKRVVEEAVETTSDPLEEKGSSPTE